MHVCVQYSHRPWWQSKDNGNIGASGGARMIGMFGSFGKVCMVGGICGNAYTPQRDAPGCVIFFEHAQAHPLRPCLVLLRCPGST